MEKKISYDIIGREPVVGDIVKMTTLSHSSFQTSSDDNLFKIGYTHQTYSFQTNDYHETYKLVRFSDSFPLPFLSEKEDFELVKPVEQIKEEENATENAD